MLRPNSRRNRVSVKIYALYREIDEETRFLKNPKFHPGMQRPNPIGISVGAKHSGE